MPWPYGALIGDRNAHSGTAVVPPDVRAGVVPQDIAAFRWNGSSFEEIPVQVDEVMPYCLSNINSDFGLYSGTDKEFSYAWDVESWKKVSGVCSAEYPEGETATPDPAGMLDDDDEIVFMASDAGDVAPVGASFPPDVSSVHAVAVIDPLAPSSPHFVYLAVRPGGSTFTSDNGLVDYARDANADEWIDRYDFADDDPEKIGSSNTGYGPNLSGTVCDGGLVPRASTDRFPRDGVTVSTDKYQFRASGRWMIRGMRIAKPDAPGDYGPDLIDRWKGRAFQQSPDSTISVVGFEDEQVNWEANSALLGERMGPVRAIREIWGADSGTNVTNTETFYRDAVTYRYHVRVHPIPPDGLYTSWDYNHGVAVKYYNTLKTDGVDIDGVNDDTGNIDAVNGQPAFFDLPDPSFNIPSALLNWEEVSGAGDAGSLVYIIEMKGATTLVNSAVVPYYRDDACLDDGTGDDPVPRPWPGEASTDQRVKDGYSALAGGTPYDQLACSQKQGAWGAHGIHYFVTGDTDNVFTPETVTEIDAMQWQFAVPTSEPTNIGQAYGDNVRIPLQTVAIDLASAPVSVPPQASDASATTQQNKPADVVLAGADLDTCELTFRIVDPPASGQVGAISGLACSAATPNTDTATVTYTPNAGFIGSDSFTYVVGDSTSESQPATVSITVTPPPPPCSGGPRTGCRVSTKSGKGQVRLSDADDTEDDSLSWKWLAGEQTDVADFGDPAATTDYELCVFDASGTAVAYVQYDAAEDCGGKPCWRSTSSGYGFSRRVEDEDGTKSTAKLTLRAGAQGKAKITASATGGLLSVGGLPPEQPVVVELRAKDGACWQATFSEPASVSEAGSFEDRAD
ncbi:MAG TPA: Ig-like domain-containing protein [Candidatus Limnocylindrales bacterium]|nr:Ig-like domain-containing protein [Candidatus Limnocylindrales bacterium]